MSAVIVDQDDLGVLLNLAAKEMMVLRNDDIHVQCGEGTYYKSLETAFNKYSDLYDYEVQD